MLPLNQPSQPEGHVQSGSGQPSQPGSTQPDAGRSSQAESINGPRNYATISPSAKTLLLLKSHTSIPYAREAAVLSMLPDPFTPDFTNREPGFWSRVVHFEVRYATINELLSGLPQHNILELSSGFSFRGLTLTQEKEINYIDTDLPDIIGAKQQYIETLSKELPAPKGHLELKPLNALDEEQFNAIADSFPPGELIIVNEGLLMYLGVEEKEKLCRFIRNILQRRGGYWITADIYLKKRFDSPDLDRGDTMKEFLEQHNIRKNMFDSFEEAAAFFTANGFTIDKEAQPDYGAMSAIQYFMASVTPELLTKMRETGKIHATWRLRVAPDIDQA